MSAAKYLLELSVLRVLSVLRGSFFDPCSSLNRRRRPVSKYPYLCVSLRDNRVLVLADKIGYTTPTVNTGWNTEVRSDGKISCGF